jgi:phosphoglycerate dehydrogenase-like enzyme
MQQLPLFFFSHFYYNANSNKNKESRRPKMQKVGVLVPHPGSFEDLVNKAKAAEGFSGDIEFIVPKSNDEKYGLIKEAVALITSGITKKELEIASNLKFIQVPFAGVDSFDIQLLTERGITLANVHSNAISVAEHAFGLLLSLAKDLVRNDRDLRKGYWHGWMGKEPNVELFGKTLCVVGLGSIGKKIAEFGKAFGMHVIGVKRNPEPYPFVDEVYGTHDLLLAIEKSQFVVVVLPLTPETKGMFNKSVFDKMSGKYFVNVGRGSVINEADLFQALKNGVLKRAAIDTWWNYPEAPMQYAMPSKYPFWELNNIIMSSHAAGYSEESLMKVWEDAMRNVVRFVMGKSPENVITEKGY